MKKYLKDVAVVLAVAVISTLGMQACSEEEVQGILLTLGIEDGYSEEVLVQGAAGVCESGGMCDGTVGLDPSFAKGGFEGPDDDFDALFQLISTLSWAGEGAENSFDEFNMREADFFEEAFGDDGIPVGQRVTFGPLSGASDFDPACAPGTGRVIVTISRTYEGVEGEMASKGPAEWGERIGETIRYILNVSNCEIEGDLLDDAGDSYVTLSGTVIWSYGYDEDESWSSLTGNLTVNPGVVATGESDPVWGATTRITFDASASDDNLDGFDESSGGICYDGTSASSESACDGIFVSANEVLNYWD